MRRFGWIAAGLTMAAGLAAGCKFPYPGDVPDDDGTAMHAIGGSVTGLWTGGAVTLHLAAGDVTEDVAASAGQPFAFTSHVLDGESYLVTVADDGPDHDCVVANGSGRVDGADVTDLDVECTNLIPHGIAISTPVDFTFDPRTTHYPLAVSILQQEVSVTVSGPTLTSAKVAGQAVTIGQPSPPVPLGQGMTTVPVDVAKGALSQHYELVFDRGAIPITEDLYARAFNAGAGDHFGVAAAASGDWAAIGADAEDSSSDNGVDDGTSRSGAVYIYHREGNSWRSTQKLKGSALATDRHLGEALAMEGDTLVVGARQDDALGVDAGAIYVFRLDAGAGLWHEEQRITATDGSRGDRFGQSVALSGDYLAASAPSYDAGTGNLGDNFGQVYIFHRSGASWSQSAIVDPMPRVVEDYFGTQVALDGDSLAVLTASRTYVYRRAGASWNEEPVPADATGTGLDLEGDDLVVGTRTYHRTGTSWSFVSDLPAPAQLPNPTYGPSVALHRDLIITTVNDQSLMAWQRIGATWVATPPVLRSQGHGFNFGYALALETEGVVVGDFRDSGPASDSQDSGTVWFFH
ncbi:MAG TPA: FG-GAP repeat protein [Kofleriaceae bacterium]|nr:FG-GAP repeat protein [Kofleriaceae bacterium]